MSVIHKECNARVEVDIAKAERLGMTPGDWGFCTKCGLRVDHLVWNGAMKGGAPYPEFSDEVIINWND